MKNKESKNLKIKQNLKLPLVMLFLSLLGLGLSIELTIIHYKTHTDPDFHSVCAVSDNVNCESVALSPYSVVAGLPVSIWGIAGYLVILFLSGAVIYYSRRLTAKNSNNSSVFLSAILFLMTLIAATVSMIMGYISYAKIASICLFCMGTYVVNVVLVTMGGILIKKSSVSFFRMFSGDITGILKKPLLILFFLIIGVFPVVTAFLTVPDYWKSTNWDDIADVSGGVNSEGDHWIGAKNPEIIVTEFTDYQCPYCRGAHKRVRKLLEKYKKRVRIVHAHYPLDDKCNSNVKFKFHEYACKFSIAAECAGFQGNFWQMNDLIFSAQESVKAKDVDIDRFVIALGLDRKKFNSCVKDKLPLKKIKKDISRGAALGIRGTPSFVIDGRIFTGGITEKQLFGNQAAR